MTLREQWAALDASPVAKTLALSFLRGFHIGAWIVISPYIGGILADPGAGLSALGHALLHSNLVYSFFNNGLKLALGYSLGQFFTAPIDKSPSSSTLVIKSVSPFHQP